MVRMMISVLLLPFPARFRRWVLNSACGYRIASDAHVGRSIIACRLLVMESGSRIGALNVIQKVDTVHLGMHASLGALNWVSAIPMNRKDVLRADAARISALRLDAHAAITNRHTIECSDQIHIGAYSTVGGWHSQIISRGLDIGENRQAVAPITIGRYCLIATRCIVVKGASLPDFSVLAAGSVLAGKMATPYRMYSGVPASPVKELNTDAPYFHRTIGSVD